MIQLTANVLQTNIVRWRVLAFELAAGQVTLRFEGAAGVQSVDIACQLSDAANGSSGVAINASPAHWDDRIVSVGTGILGGGGVGLANSLSNARTAYATAYAAAAGGAVAKQAAGLKAVELQALADGWVSAQLAGS